MYLKCHHLLVEIDSGMRDIKPENIATADMTSDGSVHIKVIDFVSTNSPLCYVSVRSLHQLYFKHVHPQNHPQNDPETQVDTFSA